MKHTLTFEDFLNESRKSFFIEISLRYAAKALDAFEDGNWMKAGGKITSTNTYEFQHEDMAMEFVETLTTDWGVPNNEISIKQ